MKHALLYILTSFVLCSAYDTWRLCDASGDPAAVLTIMVVIFVVSLVCVLVPVLFRTVLSAVGYLWICVMLYLAAFLALRDCVIGASILAGAYSDTLGTVSLYCALFLTGAVIALGIFNATSVKTVTYRVKLDGYCGKVRRIAFFSDLHIGRTVGLNHVKRVVEALEKIDGDMILFAGDMFTGHSREVTFRTEAAQLLSRLKPAYGFFACCGNHDIPSPELTEFYNTAGVTFAVDGCFESEGLRIVLRGDLQRQLKDEGAQAPLSSIIKDENEPYMPLIVLDHEPVRSEEAIEAGCSLLLCGHTHAGQLFPANILAKLNYKYDYGRFSKDNCEIIVSCGAGQWGPPVRLGSRVEAIVLEIV